MELLIGIAVVFILLLCLGASLELIATIALGCLGLFILFMTGIFVYAFIVMIMSRRASGVFVRSEKDEKSKIPFAYYIIDGVEFKNMFPLEVMFQKFIYKEGKEVKLFLNRKSKCCFDSNAVICCILGFAVSVFLVVEMIILVFGNM